MIIYIAGYGRSGSTALDLALGEIDGVMSCGELVSLPAEVVSYDFAKCGCGNLYDECEIWSDLSSTITSEDRDCSIYNNMILPVRLLFSLLFFFRHRKFLRRKDGDEFNRRVVDYIYNLVGPSCIVDSSKSSWFASLRPYSLKRAGFEVFVIHLQRDLFGVLESVKRGDNKALMGDKSKGKAFAVFRAFITYSYANFIGWFLGFSFPRIKVKQKDLKENPDLVVSNIMSEICHSYPDVAFFGSFKSHVVSGNRLKFK